MKKEFIDYTEEELDKLLEENNCPECKMSILYGNCPCSGYYGGVCPLLFEPWAMNDHYKIKLKDGEIVSI